jgi:Ca2+-binding RTX toxin-like protein
MPVFRGEIDVVGQIDTYSVSLARGVTYYFELEGSATEEGDLDDGALALARGGSVLASDNNGGVGSNARLVFTPTVSGVYSLEARGVSGSTGDYELKAFIDDYKGSVEGTGVFGHLHTGSGRSGTINYSIPEGLFGDEADEDLFAVSLISGLTYGFVQRGADLGGGTLANPRLLLLDRSGATLAGGGLGGDEEIVWSPTYTGTHYLSASSGDAIAGREGTGTYRMFATVGFATDDVDFVLGTAISDGVSGLAGNDDIRGRGGDDWLSGDGGSDILRGQSGNDILRGGGSRDTLIGGTGFDTFRIVSAAESPVAQSDVIKRGDGASAFAGAGRAAGDIIDLTRIDANTDAAGDQDFVLGGSGKGRLSLVDAGSRTLVLGNTDGDRLFELRLVILDGRGVDASDYSRADFIL